MIIIGMNLIYLYVALSVSQSVCNVLPYRTYFIMFYNSDGNNQIQGGCLRNFRNRPYPVRIKARYYENVLTVSLKFKNNCTVTHTQANL